ncbi:hypothetical protein ACFOON_16990 [Novosphingobium piscinae]|uniref:hypothetical protein n=1 Tax=Novosphingobium piscinae TaxID=1507448 RepID=UPI001FE8B586|nr:hypothetical protein [Novosphingobium piscinae]
MRTLALLCSSLLLAVPQVAAAQSSTPCLTPREFTALSTYALPSVISGTSRACATALPAGAFLRQGGTELAQRYATGKAKAWPEAKSAFLKMASAKDAGSARLFATMPDDALQQIADAAFAGIVTGQIKPDSCTTIDRVVALLAPLPPENTAELIAVAVGLGSKAGTSKLGNLPLCKA